MCNALPINSLHPLQLTENDARKTAQRSKVSVERAVGAKRKEMLGKLVEDELAAEGLDAKVRRHRQVMLQEEDDARRRGISRALADALNDPFDMPGSSRGDSNPLGRRHRLTALNPLLDDGD